MESSKAWLDAEYAEGMWDYLRDVSETPRFGIVAAYCHYYGDAGSILEVGCGEAILLEHLCSSRFSRFMGVDISSEAIRRATAKGDERTAFSVADASVFTPEEQFDVIVFNESLEYFDDPLQLVRRYEAFLSKEGVFIVSMFVGTNTIRARRIWKSLATQYSPIAEARVTTRSDRTWDIKVLLRSSRS